MKKLFFFKKFYYFLLSLLFVFLGTLFAFGADNSDQIDSPIKSVDDIVKVLKRIVDYMYTIFFIVAVGAMLWAAFTYLRAGQDSKLVDQAKKQLTFAVIAIVIALVAGGVSLIIESFLKSAVS